MNNNANYNKLLREFSLTEDEYRNLYRVEWNEFLLRTFLQIIKESSDILSLVMLFDRLPKENKHRYELMKDLTELSMKYNKIIIEEQKTK